MYSKLHDDILNDINHEFIRSGSKAECLDLPGSDFDMMVLLKLCEAYEDKTEDEGVVLMFETNNTLHKIGFA